MVHQVLLDLLDLYLDGFPSRNEVYRFNINLYLKSKTSIPISPDVQRARYDFAAGIQGSVFPNCLQPANAQMVDKFWRVVRNYNTMLNDQGIWKGNQVNDTVFEFGTENLLQSPRTTNSNGTGRDPSRLIQELEEAKKNIARLVNDNEQLATSLTKSVEDSDVVTATLRKKLQEKEKALVELTRRITELETESAKKIAAAYSSTRKCSDRMNNEPATSLQTNLKIKMDGIAKETMEKKLQKTLDDFKIKTLQTQIGSLKAETWKERALKPNNTGQNETTSILQKTLGGKDQSFKELTDKIADMTKQLVDSAGTVQNLTQKVNKLEEKKQISNLLAVDLKRRLKRKDVDIACLQNCLKVKEQSLLELNNQITEFYAENEKRIVELIALRAKYGSLEKVLTVRNELVTSLQAKVDGLTAGLRATQDTQKAGDDAQISTFETKIRNLEAELEKERAIASEQILTTKTEHALIVKTQIQMITSLQKTVEDKNQSLKELSDSLTSLTSESDSYSQMIKDKQTVIDSLKAKYLEIERRLKADQKKMIKIGEKEQQLNELRQSSKLKINSLQQRIRGLEAELAATTKQNPPSHSDTPFTAEMSKKLLSELLDTYYAVGIPSRNDVYQFNITLYQKTNTPYPISPGVWKARNVFANAIKMSELPVWIPRYTAPYNKFYRVAEKYKKAIECADSKKRKHPHNDTLFEFGTSSPSESVKAKKKMNEETKNHIEDQMQQMKTELEKAKTLLNEEKSKNEKMTEAIAKFKYAFERKALYGTSLEKKVEEAEKTLDSERRRVQELVDELKEIQARCTKLDEDKS